MFYPVLLCTLAGLSTAFGGAAVVAYKGISKEKMSFFQGFAAGVMLAVSLMDLLVESYEHYYRYMDDITAFKAVLSLFVCGWVIGAALGKTISVNRVESDDETLNTARRVAVITTAVMILHNLPEGMLTMFSGAKDLEFGAKIAFAVALHNIPEGMAIAGPVFYITKDGKKAFFQSLWAGMAEPIGGILAYILLRDYINDSFLNGIMSIIAGIMCQAGLCELVPSALKISNIKHTIYGIITGVLIMCIGLFAF